MAPARKAAASRPDTMESGRISVYINQRTFLVSLAPARAWPRSTVVLVIVFNASCWCFRRGHIQFRRLGIFHKRFLQLMTRLGTCTTFINMVSQRDLLPFALAPDHWFLEQLCVRAAVQVSGLLIKLG